MIAIQYIAKPDFTIRYILSLNAAMQFISIPSAIFCNIIICMPASQLYKSYLTDDIQTFGHQLAAP